jgi:hypothetical protein
LSDRAAGDLGEEPFADFNSGDGSEGPLSLMAFDCCAALTI